MRKASNSNRNKLMSLMLLFAFSCFEMLHRLFPSADADQVGRDVVAFYISVRCRGIPRVQTDETKIWHVVGWSLTQKVHRKKKRFPAGNKDSTQLRTQSSWGVSQRLSSTGGYFFFFFTLLTQYVHAFYKARWLVKACKQRAKLYKHRHAAKNIRNRGKTARR